MREPPAQEQVPVTPVLPVIPQREDLPTSTAECEVQPSLPYFATNPRQSTHPRSTPKRFTTKAKFRAALPKGKTFSIILDSGISQNISNCKDDCVGLLKPAPWWAQVKGIAKGLKIEAVGHVMWAVLDTNGQLRCLKLPAYYIPACKMRILSTTSYLETYNPEQICGDHTSLGFTGIPGNPTRDKIKSRVNPRNRIPTITGYEYDSCEFAKDVNEDAFSLEQFSPSQRQQQVAYSFEKLCPPHPLPVVPPAPPTADVPSQATQLSPTRETPTFPMRETQKGSLQYLQ